MSGNQKKLGIAIVAIALVALAFFVLPTMTTQVGEKEIFITITDTTTDELLLEETFNTDALTLGDFLAENADKLDVDMQDSEYGRFLNGLVGLEPVSMEEGPYWMYGYVSPAQDLDLPVGAAPGVDQINIHDGDTVNFEFTKYE